MEIKKPDIEDYDQLIDLWDICGLPYKPKGRDIRERIEKEMETHPEYWKGVYDDNRLVGVVVGTDDGRKGWINRLAVLPEFRGKGIGTKLLVSMEEEFYKKGMGIIGALIEGDNPDSLEFFEKRGYIDHDIRYYSKRERDES